ncbi:fibronectin type III domain-containing protein [Allobranchiibius sp. CTAmp26]|uniref:fibronectin type III domain-containing protein n=1 Tax=Allobranchiibius sp. CTAmp26 TaxID=2815214 RepID=UPI001AA1BEBC|nr:fibronectin type III domain-containing protein [Allobranchiibius sp. CTAmp26]MBO1756673.1 fibronectin type III domain-containing protein [Allobranchiibius sp. CTAmp26]
MLVLLGAFFVTPPRAIAAADVTTPVLNSFSADLSPVTPGQIQTLHYSASDDSGALSQVLFIYSDSLGGQHQIARSGGIPLTGTLTQTIPTTWPNGTSTLDSVYVTDAGGNVAIYRANGSIQKVPTNAVGPTSHTLDLSTANFTVDGSSADVTTPVLNSFSADLSPVTPGQIQTLHYSASDDSGALSQVLFIYSDSLGGQHQIARSGGIPLTGTLTQTIPTTWPNGTSTLDSVYVTDAGGNVAIYRANGSIQKVPTNAVGPTSHTLDLSTANFTVNDGSLHVPAKPDAPSATAGDGSATVSWNPPTNDGGAPIASYTVVSIPDGVTVKTRGTSATVAGLRNGVAYQFTVIASNAVGSSSPSDTSTAVTPLGTLSPGTVTVSGTTKVGSSLSVDPGTWGPGSVALSYQWSRVVGGISTVVAGAKGSTYALSPADAGAQLKVVVTGSESGYTTADRESALTSAVAYGTLVPVTPKVSGSVKVGYTLTATPGAWGPAPVSLTYQWYRVSSAGAVTPISGARSEERRVGKECKSAWR